MPIVAVPYSLHASFSELRRLVEAVRPATLHGVVASARFADAPIEPTLHFGHLLRRREAPPPGRALPPPAEACGDEGGQCDAADASHAAAAPASSAHRRADGGVQPPGMKSLLTLSPGAMLLAMQRVAGQAAHSALATARKRAASMRVLMPAAVTPRTGVDSDGVDIIVDAAQGQENDANIKHETPDAKRTRMT